MYLCHNGIPKKRSEPMSLRLLLLLFFFKCQPIGERALHRASRGTFEAIDALGRPELAGLGYIDLHRAGSIAFAAVDAGCVVTLQREGTQQAHKAVDCTLGA